MKNESVRTLFCPQCGVAGSVVLQQSEFILPEFSETVVLVDRGAREGPVFECAACRAAMRECTKKDEMKRRVSTAA